MSRASERAAAASAPPPALRRGFTTLFSARAASGASDGDAEHAGGGAGGSSERTSLLGSAAVGGPAASKSSPFAGLAREAALSGAPWRERLAARACGNRVSPRTAGRLAVLGAAVAVAAVGAGGAWAGAPYYVASRIAATSLVFSSLDLRDAHTAGPPSAWGFTLVAAGTLSGLSPVGGTLAPFAAALRFPPGGPALASFTMPQIAAAAGVDNAVALAVPVALADEGAFAAFGAAAVGAAFVDAEITGTVTVTTVFAGVSVSIPGVPFKKTLRLPGARGLPGANVTAFSLAGSNATAANVALAVSVVNPSVLSITPLGDLNLGVYFQGVRMGGVAAANVSLAPGANALAFSGTLVGGNATASEALISAYLGGESVAVVAVGEPGGPGASPLFAPIVQSLSLSASLSGAAVGAPPLIAGVAVSSMFLSPRGAAAVGIDLNVTVSVTNLLGAASPIFVRTVALDCDLNGDGVALGRLVVPTTAVNQSSNGLPAGRRRALAAAGAGARAGADDDDVPVFNVSLPLSAELTITGGDSPFAAFVRRFISAPTVSLGLVSPAGPDGAPTPGITVAIKCALGELAVSIPLAQYTSVPGIDGFPSVEVSFFSVTRAAGRGELPSGREGILTALTVAITNPSVAAFPLGDNATLGIYAPVPPGAPGAGGLVRLGYAVIVNRTLLPGVNTFQLTGVVDPDPADAAALPAASALFSAYLAGANASATVKGESVSLGPGAVTPAWLSEAVANISLAATLPGLDSSLVPSLLVDIAALSLGLAFDDAQPGAPTLSGRVRGVLQLPFSLDGVSVGAANATLLVVEVLDDGSDGRTIGALNVTGATADWFPCNTTAACAAAGPQPPLPPLPPPVRGGGGGGGGGGGDARARAAAPALVPVGALVLNLPPTRLAVTDAAAFTSLVSGVLRRATVRLRLVGTAAPTVYTPVGALAITGVRVDAAVSLPGLANFTASPPIVQSGDITNTSACCLFPVVTFNITNPAPLAAALGPVKLGVRYAYEGDETIPVFVTAAIPSFALPAGPGETVTLVSIGRLFVPAEGAGGPDDARVRAAGLSLLSRFLSGKSTNVTLVGLPDSSPYPLLAPALDGFTAPAVFPGLPEALLTNGTLYVDAAAVLAGNLTAPGFVTLSNTLSVALSLANFSITVYACKDETPDGADCRDGPDYGDAIGFLELRKGQPPPAAPPKSVVRSPVYPVQLVGTAEDDAALFLQIFFDGDAVTKANGTICPRLQAPGSEAFQTTPIYFEQFRLRMYTTDVPLVPVGG